MAKLNAMPQSWGVRYLFFCPGCGCHHMFDVRTDGCRPAWTFDGNLDSPTFAPSLLYPDRVCHLFVRGGRVEFLNDCTHGLRGETVPMVDLEE